MVFQSFALDFAWLLVYSINNYFLSSVFSQFVNFFCNNTSMVIRRAIFSTVLTFGPSVSFVHLEKLCFAVQQTYFGSLLQYFKCVIWQFLHLGTHLRDWTGSMSTFTSNISSILYSLFNVFTIFKCEHEHW